MAQDKKEDISLYQEASKIIEALDKLAYEKPAGYQGFLAMCGSSMKLSDFRQPVVDKEDPPTKK